MKTVRQAVCFVMTAAFVLGGLPHTSGGVRVFAAESVYDEIQVLKGDIETIRTNNLKRVSITDPTIADINDARARAVEVIGLEAGQTVLFIWDDTGKRTVVIRVVTEDLGLVKRRVKALLESAGISGLAVTENSYEGKIVVSGGVSESKEAVLKGLLQPLGDRVINLTERAQVDDLVQIDMQVTELGTTLTKELGVDWGTGTATSETLALEYTENLPTDTHIPRHSGSFRDLFKVGDFSRTPALVAAINALIVNGKAKVLSKPRLVVVSGKEAKFLVGGQVPIKSTTTSSSGGSTTENTEFKDYGLSMSITPSIENGKMVSVMLNMEISEIDGSNPSTEGLAFLTRTAQTQLVMEDRQTIVLAGLIKRRDSETIRRVPLLGSIPLVGALFRSKKTPTANSETELVISITPTILRAGKPLAEVKPAAVEPPRVKAEPSLPPAVPRAVNPVISKAVNVPPQLVSASGPGAGDYALLLQQKITSAIAYPFEAQENGWEGTVKLSLLIQRDGTLKSVVVKESSGHEVFDQDALNTAQILAPYAAFSSDMEGDEMTVTIPIVYSLDGFLKNVAAQ